MGTQRFIPRMDDSRLPSAAKRIAQRLPMIDRDARTVFLSFCLIAIFLSSFGDVVLSWPVHINLIFALFIIATVWGRIQGVLGVVLGTLLGTLTFGGNLLLGTIDVLSFVLGSVIVLALWTPHQTERPVLQPVVSLLGYGASTLCAVAVAVASAGVLHEIMGIRPVYVAMIDLGIGLWISALLVAGPVLGIRYWRMEYRPPVVALPNRLRFSIAGLSLGWVVVAFIGSAGYHLGSAVPDWLFERHGIGWAPALLNDYLFGVGAIRVQILVGSIVITLLLFVVWTGMRSNPEGDTIDE